MQMNRFKKWMLAVLSVVFPIVAFVVLVNCIVDTYGILRTDFSRQYQEPNKSVIKIKYLLGNNKKFDSFVFGSSRVNNIDEKKIVNGSYYNMTYSEGLPTEHLKNIRVLIRRGVAMKNILIGLDEFSYMVDPRTHAYDLLRQPHPAVSGKSGVTFYAEYFVKSQNLGKSLREYIEYNYGSANDRLVKKFFFDLYDSGRSFCKSCEEEIEADVERHRTDRKFEKPKWHYAGDNMAQTLDDIRNLVEMARENNIKLILFINPIHKTTYLDTNLKQLFTFKEELAKITDYYDFSGLNTITTDNYYYFETSHYRPMVGDMMLFRMFGEPKVKIPRDFGVLVTRKSVGVHLIALCRQLKSADSIVSEQNALFRDECKNRYAEMRFPDFAAARPQGRE